MGDSVDLECLVLIRGCVWLAVVGECGCKVSVEWCVVFSRHFMCSIAFVCNPANTACRRPLYVETAVCNITGGHRPISVQSFVLAAQWRTRAVLVANRYFWKGGWRSKSSLQLSLLLC